MTQSPLTPKTSVHISLRFLISLLASAVSAFGAASLAYQSQVAWFQAKCRNVPLAELPNSCASEFERLTVFPCALGGLVFASTLFVFLSRGIKGAKKNLKNFALAVLERSPQSKKLDAFVCYGTAVLMSIWAFHKRYGIEQLDPRRSDWLQFSDPAQAYLGSVLFRMQPWQYPLGRIDTIMEPHGANVGFTDSGPLPVILAKLFRGAFLPEWQFFGIWLLLCSVAFAGFSTKLARQLQGSLALRTSAAVVLSFFPAFLYRGTHGHVILSAMFFIPATVLIFRKHAQSDAPKKQDKSLHKSFLGLSGLVLWNSWVHPYLTFMSIVLFACFLFCHRKPLPRFGVSCFALSVLGCAISWKIIGYFSGPAAQTDSRFPQYFTTNLNFLWNSFGYSEFLRARPIATAGQTEAFGYLGLGVLFLFVAFAGSLKLQTARSYGQRNRAEILSAFVFLTLSFGCLLSFDSVKLEIPIPVYGDLLAIFRSTGRFVWLPSYVLTVFVLHLARESLKKEISATLVFVGAGFLQIMDLSPLLRAAPWFESSSNHAQKSVVLQDLERWKDPLQGIDHIAALPALSSEVAELDDYRMFWRLAIKYKVGVNVGYLARKNKAEAEKETARLENALETGQISPRTAIVFAEEKFYKIAPTFRCEKILAYTFCRL